jgi:EAL domain-containing protein (putative c-di-GMP-specific phosphodiesterase class I)
MMPEPPPAPAPAARGFSWRYPRRGLQELLNAGYRRYGRLRVNVIVGCACISISSVALLLILNYSFVQGQLARIGGDGVQAERLFQLLCIGGVLLIAAITSAAYLVLHIGVIRPVERFREKARPEAGGPGHSELLAALTFDRDRRSEQLDAALTDNERLRQRLDELAAAQEQASRLLRSAAEAPGARLAGHDTTARAGRQGGTAPPLDDGGAAGKEQQRSELEWSQWVQTRLDGGFLRLASQEIRPLGPASGSLPMFEVFVRIEDEDGVWVTPGAFLGAAQRHQLSARLDLEVLRAVLGQLQLNPQLTEKYACACINLSAASFASEGFAGELLQILALSGVPAPRICLEIDAAEALSHKAALRRFIEALRPAGIRFALDRYRAVGGLYELRAAPIDFVKLHESLLRCLDPAQQDEIGLKHLHWASDIAAALNITTVATGIENEALLGPLQSAGVRYAQGLALNKLGPLLLA